MAVSDYSPLGLAKRFFTPQQDYGWNMKTTTSKPLINFNASGFNPPMAGGQTIKPTVGVQSRNASPVSLAKPAAVVAPVPVSTAPKGAGDRATKKATAPKTSGTLKAPPPMVPAVAPAAATAVVAPEVMGAGIAEPQLEAYGNVAPTTIPGLAGFKDMNSYAQNDALYKAGLQESYTPDQLAQLEGLDTTSLANPVQSPGIGSSLAGAWEGIGGAKGLADLSGGLASLYSIYSGNEQNKRANEALNMQKAEYNRGVQKDKDFATAMNKSGLGAYSAGLA